MLRMKKILLCLFLVDLVLPCLHAQNREADQEVDSDRSSALTPTAPRHVTMASPAKPAWQAEPHGK